MKGKNVLVIGLGVSGVAAVKALSELGANIFVYDSKDSDSLHNILEKLKDYNVTYYLNDESFDVENIDLVIKSPGVKFTIPVIQKLIKSNKKIISDLEAGYLVTNNKFIAITGTNGKTTTTTLIGEIIKLSKRKYKLTGNIGSGVFYDSLSSQPGELLVVEASSFQLESTYEFKPFVSIITNLTPDHLDWHGSVQNYYDAKFKICINQDENDYTILNYEDDIIRSYVPKIKSNIIFFSSERILDKGIYVENNKIVYNDGNTIDIVMDVDDIFIVGKHNLENVLSACAAAKVCGIDNDIIAKAVSSFKGVEHRLEYVGTYNNVKFYNDSKGTNPDASIKAVLGVKAPIILIAGGYDKNSNYDEFIECFDGKVKSLILLGATREKIEQCALEHGFTNIIKVNNMDEAVKKAFEISEINDTVVLSPACASWDMYKSYEVRGEDFKERVKFYGDASKKE